MRAILWFVFIAVLAFSQCKKASPSPDPDNLVESVSDTTKIVAGPQEDELLVRFDRGFEKELIRLGIDKLGKEDGKIRYSDVRDIESLTVRPQIKEDIQGLKGIEYFVNLKSLITLYAKPDTLDLSKNTKLEYLHIETGYEVAGERKTLKYLNVSNCKELKYLNCKSNMLSKLDLSQNKKLTELDCSDNYNLKMLDLSVNTELKVLRVYGGLNVSANEKLETLTIQKLDQLQLNLTKNSNLRELYGYDWTSIKELDLRSCKKLEKCIIANSSSLTRICVNTLPGLDDKNWIKPNQTEFQLCN